MWKGWLVIMLPPQGREEALFGKNEDAVNKFLRERKQITLKQTYREVSDAYAKSIIEFPAKFLALALASNSKD